MEDPTYVKAFILIILNFLFLNVCSSQPPRRLVDVNTDYQVSVAHWELAGNSVWHPRDLLQSRTGHIWILTMQDLIRLGSGGPVFFDLNDLGIASNDIPKSITESSDGTIWLIVEHPQNDLFSVKRFDPQEEKGVEMPSPEQALQLKDLAFAPQSVQINHEHYIFIGREGWQVQENGFRKILSDADKHPREGSSPFYLPAAANHIWKLIPGEGVFFIDSVGTILQSYPIPGLKPATFDWQLDEEKNLIITYFDTPGQSTPYETLRITPDTMQPQLKTLPALPAQKIWPHGLKKIFAGEKLLIRQAETDQLSLFAEGGKVIPNLDAFLLETTAHPILNGSPVFVLGETDFFIFSTQGLIRTQLLKQGPIKTFLSDAPKSISTRGITAINAQELLVHSYAGNFIVNLVTGKQGLLPKFSSMGIIYKSKLVGRQLLAINDYKSFFKYNFQTGESERIVSNVPIFPNDLAFLSEGRILVGARKGLYEVDTVQKKFKLSALRDTAVFSIFVQGEENWAGTSHGIYSLTEKKLYPLPELLDTFPDKSIYHIYRDRDGIFWLASSLGLIAWDKAINQFTRYDFGRTPGFRNRIHAIYEDRKQNLWLSSNNGIIKFNEEDKDFFVYTKRDGLSDNECNFLSHYQADDGTLYFGGINGVNYFNPENLPERSSQKLNPVFIEKVAAIIPGQGPQNNLTNLARRGQPIKLPSRTAQLNIQFDIPFSSTEHLAYQWRIPGKHQEWLPLNEPNLILSQPYFGTYSIQLRGIDKDNPQFFSETALSIRMEKPFYQRWSFYLGIFSLLLLAFWGYRQNQKAQKAHLRKIIARNTKELKEKYDQLSVLTEKLKETDINKTRFFTNVSHEIRTPLALILGRLEKALAQEALPGDLNVLLNKARESTLQMAAMVDDLLEITNFDRQEISVEQNVVRWPSFFASHLSHHQELAERKQIHFDLELSPNDEQFLRIDRDKTLKILNNLIGNAIKFTPVGGEIYLSGEIKNSRVLFKVSDTGPGIPEEEQARIFDRYYSKTPAHLEHISGFGIGLALCKQYAEALPGKLWVESQVGKGSTFYLQLAHIPGRTEEYQPIPKKSPSLSETDFVTPPVFSPTDGQAHILIAEDNKEMQDLLKELLSVHYQLTIVDDGKAAFARIKKGQDFDLIISDIMMPEMDGYSLLKAVRKNQKNLVTPFLMLTALKETHHKNKALRLGVDNYLAKPFQYNELFAHIENILQHHKRRRQHFEKTTHAPVKKDAGLIAEMVSFDDKWLSKLERTVEKLLHRNNLKVKEISDQLHISERSLRSKLKSQTGLSPTQYVLKARLNKARLYIESKKYKTLKEVCKHVGLKSMTYFSNEFRKEFGVTPSEYANDQIY